VTKKKGVITLTPDPQVFDTGDGAQDEEKDHSGIEDVVQREDSLGPNLAAILIKKFRH
jgi:hypothetical protein